MKKMLLLLLLVAVTGCKSDPKAQRDKYFESGQKYLSEKKYEEAAIEFRNALRADNGHISSYIGLARSLQQLDDQLGALAIFRRVNELDARNKEAKLELGRYMLGAAYQNPELFKKARELAEQVLGEQPDNIEARILLGNAYAGLNDTVSSTRELEKALASDPENLSALLLRGSVEANSQSPVKAEQTFKETIEKHPDSPEAHIAIAEFYSSRGNLVGAEAEFKTAFNLDAGNPLSLYSLVRFYLINKDEIAAESILKEAISRKPDAREPQWALANFYLRQRKFSEGLRVLEGLLRKDPRDRQAQLRRAEAYLARRQLKEAQSVLNTIFAGNKNDAEAHFLQGRLLVAEEKLDKALEEFEISIKSKSWLLPPHLMKALLLIEKNDLEGAQSSLNEVLRRDRQNITARALLSRVLVLRQRPQDAIQMAEQVRREVPYNENALLARADGLRGAGKLDGARRDYVELCRIRPQSPRYWHGLAIVEAMEGDSISSLGHLRKSLDLDPNYSAAINDILYLHVKERRFDEALSELNRLARSSAREDEIHRFRGQVLLTKGDMSGAEAEFRKAIEINSQNFQSYIMLGQISHLRDNLPQAIREVDRLIAQNSKIAPPFLLKAYYLQLLDDFSGAITNYRKALELDSENAVAGNNLAWLLCESGSSLEEALSLARSARKKAPENPDIADTLGWIYYKMKNYTLAVDQLLYSVNSRKEPKPEHYYRLGMAYYARGDLLLAKQMLGKALAQNPKMTGAEEARKVLKQPA